MANRFQHLIDASKAGASKPNRFAHLVPKAYAGNEEGKANMQSLPASVQARDAGRSFGAGLRSGVETLAGTVGDMQDLVGSGAGWIAGKMGASPDTQEMISGLARNAPTPFSLAGRAPRTAEIQEQTTQAIGPHYRPQTTLGEYARTGGEFAPAAAAGPGGIGRKVAMTAIPAIASEGAGQATKGTELEPYARAGAAILAGGVTAGTKTGATNKVLKEASKASKALQTAKDDAYRIAEETVGKQPMQPKEFADLVRSFNREAAAKGVGGSLSEATDAMFSTSNKITGALNNVLKGVATGQRPAPTYGELEKLRQTLNEMVESSKNVQGKLSPDGYLAKQFISRLDEAIGKTPFKEGRDAYQTLRKTERIERAIKDAETRSSSTDLAYKNEFKKILRENERNKMFSPTEIAAIRRVAGHGSLSNTMEGLGRAGFSKANVAGPTALTALLYAVGLGPIGSIGVTAATTAAKVLGTRMTKSRAKTARDITSLGGKKLEEMSGKLSTATSNVSKRRAVSGLQAQGAAQWPQGAFMQDANGRFYDRNGQPLAAR